MDRESHTIRKTVISDGTVSTIAGTAGAIGSTDAKGVDARFSFPWGIAIDTASNLYVTDLGNTIRKITPLGEVSTLAGKAGISGSADGGGVARFNFPTGIVTDNVGNVYVSDTNNHTIRKITSNGIVSTVIGVAGQGSFSSGALPGLLTYPQGITFNGSSLYIAMSNGVAVVKNFR